MTTLFTVFPRHCGSVCVIISREWTRWFPKLPMLMITGSLCQRLELKICLEPTRRERRSGDPGTDTTEMPCELEYRTPAERSSVSASLHPVGPPASLWCLSTPVGTLAPASTSRCLSSPQSHLSVHASISVCSPHSSFGSKS